MTQQEAVLSKVTRPKLENVFLREKFFGILDKCREKPVIWLSAPPGSGKTTLVSSYIESRGLKCLWYQLDSDDVDLATFFHYMGIAAAQAGSGGGALPHLTPEYQLGLQSFAREYFARLYEKLGSGSLIVLDNYQELPHESVFHDLLCKAVSEMPEGINVAIISRTSPPSVLSRLRPNQLMEVITWDELRLTADEVKGVVSKMGSSAATDDEARRLLSRTDGWVAGLVLMHQCADSAASFAGPMSDYNSEEVFNYFAEEFFQKFAPPTREFLLKSAVLPTMTLEMAKELTGDDRAPQIVSQLARKNYFIQSHPGEPVRYQYHPLFREFLTARLARVHDPGEVRRLESRAALFLKDSGHVDDAVRLLRKNGEWGELADLICAEAPEMLSQGRHQTLGEWLDKMPGEAFDENRWLHFWRGSCLLPFDQPRSRDSFQAAYEAFYREKDPAGVYLSWCGVVEATIHEFDNLHLLDEWIGLLEGLLAEFPEFPSREIENRVSLSMFTALSFRAPGHPQMARWVDKTASLMDEIPDPDTLAQVALYLVDYFLWVGEMERADVIVERLSKGIKAEGFSPMAFISVKVMEALNSWYHGDADGCSEAVTEGLEEAGTRGVNVFNYFLYGHGAIGRLTCGDLSGAEEYLKSAAVVMDERKRLCASYYHHITACHRLLTKDLSGALEHEKLAVELAVKTGSPFGEGMSRSGLALIYYEIGETSRASAEIEKALEIATATGSRLIEYVCRLFDSYFALNDGSGDEGVKKLEKAMALGSRKGFVNFHMWNPGIMTTLALAALKEGIEAEYVRGLVSRRGLFPDEPPLEVENWPWRLKVNVLGKFSVIKDDRPVGFSKKAPKKPIDMLKLLISLGGRDVPETRISDVLWEDADGDAAHVAFTTTLKRLRGLLGVDGALVLASGCLSLDPRLVWVDVFAFDHLVNLAEERSADELDPLGVALLERAVGIYGDGFKAGAGAEKWATLFHERVRSKFIRCITSLCSYWEDKGDVEKAIECYQKGIEKEPFSEELYQRLMVCQERRGNRAEALATYRRLTKVFTNILGIEPSTETKDIYDNLNG